MKLWNALRARRRRRHTHLIGQIAEAPTIVQQYDVPYMVFHVSEAPGIEFSPANVSNDPEAQSGRPRGDLLHVPRRGTAEVESLLAAPDEETMRQRHRDYLTRIRRQGQRSSLRSEADQGD